MGNNPLFNKKVVLSGIIIALVILTLGAIFLLWVGPNLPKQPLNSQNYVITIIPAATSTPRAVSPSPLPVSPTPPPTFTPLPGVIAINTYVQITGTDGDGLRLRAAPSLSSDPLFLGNEAEVFLVVDGPQDSDGYTWWYLTAPYDATRSGWAVANYLVRIPYP
jgi:hypothetical protein